MYAEVGQPDHIDDASLNGNEYGNSLADIILFIGEAVDFDLSTSISLFMPDFTDFSKSKLST